MINFRYPHLTAGYLGIRVEGAALNSSFYAEIFSNPHYISESVTLPQRTPRREFFTEILSLEESNTVKVFKQFREDLKSHTFNTLQMVLTNKLSPRVFLNYINLLLRYGLSEVVCNIDSKSLFASMNTSNFIEFELLKEIAHFQSNDSRNIDNISNLADKALFQSDLTNRVKIIILNYLIVAAYRFNIKLPYKECLKKCSETLLKLIELDCTDDFGSIIRKSVAYRDLAMVKEYGQSLQNDFLKKAEQIARNIKPSGVLEEILAKENLYTCLQTLSKWNTSLGLLEQAKSNLTEMVNIDPFDSTGYSEMAFFLSNHDKYEEAASHFKLASELGSPGVGMNTYYYAKCLQILGKTDDAIVVLYESTKTDPEAVSPWIDLFDYYSDANNLTKQKEIALVLLTNPIYRNQLEEDEIDKMKEFIH